MPALRKATKERTWTDRIVNILIQQDRPLKAYQIHDILIRKRQLIDHGNFYVYLHNAVKLNRLTAVKYPNARLYYGLNAWIKPDKTFKDKYKPF